MVSASVNRNTMKGFTLIELLVVVAIIALLISILLPSLTDAREQARKVKCGANLHGLAQAMMLCANENEGYFPTWDDEAKYAYQDPKTGFSMMASWADTLFDLGYAANRDMQLCPTRRKDEYFSSNRGKAWGTGYVNRFGVGEDFKPGNYTAYGLRTPWCITTGRRISLGNETRQIYGHGRRLDVVREHKRRVYAERYDWLAHAGRAVRDSRLGFHNARVAPRATTSVAGRVPRRPRRSDYAQGSAQFHGAVF